MTRGHLFKGQGHTLQIVVKPCNHDTDWTVSARTIKLGTHISYDKRKTPIDFQGHGSKVKVTCKTLLLYLVNNINPFHIANYSIISLFNSPIGRILQRWRCSCYFIEWFRRLFRHYFLHWYSTNICIHAGILCLFYVHLWKWSGIIKSHSTFCQYFIRVCPVANTLPWIASSESSHDYMA